MNNEYSGMNNGRALRLMLCVVLFSLLLTASALILGSIAGMGRTKESKAPAVSETYRPTIIIDAGHGGEDGGTQSADGLLEKDVNLDIAIKLRDLLRACGCEVVMTREDDILLYTENVKGTKKAQDLRNRCEIARGYPSSIFVSIHSNYFPQTKYSGLQVYYSPNAESSRILAEAVQTNTKSCLQPENDRVVKCGDKGIYLLERIETTAILVECGFLSNPEEAALLADDGYRSKLAAVLCKSITDCIAGGITSDTKGT